MPSTCMEGTTPLSSLEDTMQQRIRDISSRDTENFILVWLDSTSSELNVKTQNIIHHFQCIVGTTETFTDLNECVNFLTNTTDAKFFVVISDNHDEKLIPLLQELTQIDSIYVFCGDQLKYEQFFKRFQKVRGVFIKIEYLYDALKQDVRQCNRHLTPISVVRSRYWYGDDGFDKNDQSFMYTQLLKETLLDMSHDNEAKQELATFCRVQYAGNNAQLKMIDEFEQQYDQPSPIWWYTRECFIYWMLNNALRTQDTVILMKMGFFLRDLHHQIEQLYLTANSYDHNIVFRGQGMSHLDFEKVKQSKGNFLSFNSFLSTSMVREVALLYADSARQNRNLMGVLFRIEIDLSIEPTPFAYLGSMGYFGASEKEVLFSMHTVFRIGDICEIDSELWEVNLTLVGQNDKLLTPLTEHFRKEVQGELPLHRVGKLMIKMGQFDQAENVYDRLVQNTSTDDYCALGLLYHQLGLVKHEKGELKNALSYYEKALASKQQFLSPEHPDMAATYTNIGSVYQSMEVYSTALEYFEKALKIREKFLPPRNPLLVIACNNIGSVYQVMGEISMALSYYEKAFEISGRRYTSYELSGFIKGQNTGLQHQSVGEYSTALSYYSSAWCTRGKLLGINHPLLTVTHNNMGSVYTSMKKYSEALESYGEALRIQQKMLPPYHPSFAITYDNIGLAYLSMEDYSESLSYYGKALKIRHKTLPPSHPDLARTYINIAKVLENLHRYKEAVDYAARAVEIVQQAFSAEHPTIKENQEYLDFLREKL